MNFFDVNLEKTYGLFYTGGKINFSSNGKEIIFATGNKISKIDIFTKKIDSLNFLLRSFVIALDVERKGKFMIAIDTTNLMVLIDLKKKKIEGKTILNNECSLIKWSPRGKYIALVIKNDVQIWKPNLNFSQSCSFFQLSKTYNGNYGPIWDLEWDSSGEFLIAGGYDKILKIFSFRKKRKFFEFHIRKFKSEILFVKFPKNSNSLLVLTGDNFVTQWSFPLREEISKLSFPEKSYKLKQLAKSKIESGKKILTAFYIDESSQLIFIGQADGKILGFNLSIFLTKSLRPKQILVGSKLKRVCSLNTNYGEDSPVSFISGSSGSSMIIIGKFRNGKILIFDQINKKILFSFGDSGNCFTCADVSPNEQLISTGNQRGGINIWSRKSGFCLLKFFNHNRQINQVVFSKKNSRTMFSSSSDGTLKIFDLRKGVVIRTLFSDRFHRSFDFFSVDDSGFFLASSCKKTFLIDIWSVKSGRVIESLEGHRSKISFLSFQKNKINLISGGSDKTIRVWNLENLKLSNSCSCDLLNIIDNVTNFSMHPKKKEMVASSDMGFFYFFNLEDFSSLVYSIYSLWKKQKSKNFYSDKIVVNSVSYSNDGESFALVLQSRFLLFFTRSPFNPVGLFIIPKIKIISKFLKADIENQLLCNDISETSLLGPFFVDLKSAQNSNNFLLIFKFFFFIFSPTNQSVGKKQFFRLEGVDNNLWEKTSKWGHDKNQKILNLNLMNSFSTGFFSSSRRMNLSYQNLPLNFFDRKISLRTFFFSYWRVISDREEINKNSTVFFGLLEKIKKTRLALEIKLEKIISLISLELQKI